MTKLDPTVKRETLYVAGFSLVFSVAMEVIFLLLGKWNLSVLLGNALGYAAAVGNFLAIGLTVQKALAKDDEKKIKDFVKMSHTLRMFLLLAVGVLACVLPLFHSVAALVPYLFPRIALTVRGLRMKRSPAGKGEADES